MHYSARMLRKQRVSSRENASELNLLAAVAVVGGDLKAQETNGLLSGVYVSAIGDDNPLPSGDRSLAEHQFVAKICDVLTFATQSDLPRNRDDEQIIHGDAFATPDKTERKNKKKKNRRSQYTSTAEDDDGWTVVGSSYTSITDDKNAEQVTEIETQSGQEVKYDEETIRYETQYEDGDDWTQVGSPYVTLDYKNGDLNWSSTNIVANLHKVIYKSPIQVTEESNQISFRKIMLGLLERNFDVWRFFPKPGSDDKTNQLIMGVINDMWSSVEKMYRIRYRDLVPTAADKIESQMIWTIRRRLIQHASALDNSDERKANLQRMILSNYLLYNRKKNYVLQINMALNAYRTLSQGEYNNMTDAQRYIVAANAMKFKDYTEMISEQDIIYKNVTSCFMKQMQQFKVGHVYNINNPSSKMMLELLIETKLFMYLPWKIVDQTLFTLHPEIPENCGVAEMEKRMLALAEKVKLYSPEAHLKHDEKKNRYDKAKKAVERYSYGWKKAFGIPTHFKNLRGVKM